MKIAILGSTGYVGQHMVKACKNWGIDPICPSRKDAINIPEGADVIICCIGFTGKPNVDACEEDKEGCMYGNVHLPTILALQAHNQGVPFGYISSGCIYQGDNGGRGWSEEDEPNFSFHHNNCSFYSGCKADFEYCCMTYKYNIWLWRLRVPFTEENGPRNYLTKVSSYPKLLNARNSLSNLNDFCNSCIKCAYEKMPFGIYNLTNPGSVTTKEVVEFLKRHNINGARDKEFKFFESEEEFNKTVKAPRSSCVLNTDKATSYNLMLTPVKEALEYCCENWKP